MVCYQDGHNVIQFISNRCETSLEQQKRRLTVSANFSTNDERRAPSTEFVLRTDDTHVVVLAFIGEITYKR
jgi:hypothetical protein